MKSLNQKIKNKALRYAVIFGLLILTLNLRDVNFADAQTAPEFMVTWKALNYVPSDYLGKTLPSASSFVEAGLDILDKGKTADLSRNIISWYANNSLIRSGVGLRTIKYNIGTAQSQILRVVIADYNGAEISDSFLIPVQKNELVISPKTPNNNLLRNRTKLSASSHTMEARPFFFNTNDLSGLKFSWKINDQVVPGTAGNPNFLSLDLKTDGTPQETELSISAGVSNLSNPLELGNRTFNFIVK